MVWNPRDHDASTRVVDLDHAATTRLRPEARSAMEPFLADRYGNPSGIHAAARDALRALDEARERVAGVLGCTPGEVVLTSGGTESDVHAVSGGMPPRPGVPVCAAAEHHAVLRTVEALDGRVVDVDAAGRVDLDALGGTLESLASADRGASVVSVALANNELGTVVDLEAVASVVRRTAPGVPLHTDAVQAAPWLDLRVRSAPASLVSVSGHKFGGPRGSGVLVVRGGVELRPLLPGGGQERGRRSGSVDVAGAVGLAAALEAASVERSTVVERVGGLRDRLVGRLLGADVGVRRTVEPTDGLEVLPNFAHVRVPGVEVEPLLYLLDEAGLRVASASSCSSGAHRASHVLEAVASAGAVVDGAALRLTLGPETTADDVDHAAEVVVGVVGYLLDRRSGGRTPAASGGRR